MFSIPLIIPREDHSVFYNPSQYHVQPTSSEPLDHQARQAAAQSNSQGGRRPAANTRSALSILAQDENTLSQRKQNVRRFGAGWIRPPGIAKTYQATMDELAEREEQEALARRDQQMMELAELEAQRQAQEGGEAGDEDGEGERDLDDDIPEAEGETEDVTFNEDSLLEGSIVQQDGNAENEAQDDEADVEQMLEMEEAEIDGVLQDERDLDDDVPEAGSYEHTDTELEDDTNEIEDPFAGHAGGGGRLNMEQQARRSFASAEASSILGGSSFLESSPAAGRGRGRDETRGATFRDRLMNRRAGQ